MKTLKTITKTSLLIAAIVSTGAHASDFFSRDRLTTATPDDLTGEWQGSIDAVDRGTYQYLSSDNKKGMTLNDYYVMHTFFHVAILDAAERDKKLCLTVPAHLRHVACLGFDVTATNITGRAYGEFTGGTRTTQEKSIAGYTYYGVATAKSGKWAVFTVQDDGVKKTTPTDLEVAGEKLTSNANWADQMRYSGYTGYDAAQSDKTPFSGTGFVDYDFGATQNYETVETSYLDAHAQSVVVYVQKQGSVDEHTDETYKVFQTSGTVEIDMSGEGWSEQDRANNVDQTVGIFGKDADGIFARTQENPASSVVIKLSENTTGADRVAYVNVYTLTNGTDKTLTDRVKITQSTTEIADGNTSSFPSASTENLPTAVFETVAELNPDKSDKKSGGGGSTTLLTLLLLLATSLIRSKN